LRFFRYNFFGGDFGDRNLEVLEKFVATLQECFVGFLVDARFCRVGETVVVSDVVRLSRRCVKVMFSVRRPEKLSL